MTVYKPSAECFDAADEASGHKLSREEINAAFQHMADRRARLADTGDITGTADKLRSFAEREAERTKIAAAMQRRHAALNILVRDRIDQSLEQFTKAGMTPRQAILALMEGSQKQIAGARNSVGALRLAYESKYLGGLFATIERERPQVKDMLADPRFDEDVVREMVELRDGGRPGITRNEDARYVAKTFAAYSEMARTDLNRLGAAIGKLDGWSGPQTHDDLKLMKAGKDPWIDFILPRLDIARTFPDVSTAEEAIHILGGIYDEIVTGVPNKATAREKGERVNPANLAKSLGKSRVLHFKGADEALSYRSQFGYGTAVSGMVSQMKRMAGMAAQMERFGPNPDVMIGSVVESQKRALRASDMPDEKKVKLIKQLDADKAPIRDAASIMMGMATRPASTTWAEIGGSARAVLAMAKLGGAVLTAIPSDTVTAGLASQFRGSGFLRGIVAQIEGIMHGRPKGEQAEIAHLFGEGLESITSQIASSYVANDGPVGKLAHVQETFFRWSGLSFWDTVARSTAGRTIAAEMGMRAANAWDKLPGRYRNVLELQGITPAKWEAIRQAEFRVEGGKAYVTPDRIEALPDEAIAPLVKDRIAAAPTRESEIVADARRELAMDVRRFVADETRYAMIQTDARSRRTTTWGGYRPGTIGGEVARFVMQFKGFPVAFTQRVLGRAIRSIRGDTLGEKIANGAPHIGAMIFGLGMAGYLSIVMKDFLRGYWPPRDPSDPKTWIAALQQGGGLGIYGDFLFGNQNRFNSGLVETASGPGPGALGDLWTIYSNARQNALEGKKSTAGADALNFAINNAPFANLAYVRPALDYLIINAARETVSPGYLQRRDRNRQRDYGQTQMLPQRAF